ncbi:MAG TPA: Rossmann fold nucleotide-binding protein [Segeticoccus sp.]|jgi:predicted Rossmann-fold nucleotide-binding protein|nr:Rossmann fold nucleotide-binding protein [Segeticoccus sp.]
MPTLREIETLAALDRALAGGGPLAGLRLRDLDLRAHEERLLEVDDFSGVVVLGGELTPRLERHLRHGHAIIFPTAPRAPVDPYRAVLYSPEELYAGLDRDGYAATPDACAYAWSRDARARSDAFVTLLRAIHDDSVGDALDELVEGHSVVGVMGGHAIERGSEQFADAAVLGHDLAEAGLLVATGGGPGAMEAANLGAWLRDGSRLREALDRLAAVPRFAPDVGAWAQSGLGVRRALRPEPGSAPRSVGVPTWFYGHEPPNVFGDGIAKFFSNAVREDGLLARCNAGIVVLAGAAGTVQEIFQVATRLYYEQVEPGSGAFDASREGVDAPMPPLVLVGGSHWRDGIPAWPALQALGRGRRMAGAIHLVDTMAEAAEVVRRRT